MSTENVAITLPADKVIGAEWGLIQRAVTRLFSSVVTMDVAVRKPRSSACRFSMRPIGLAVQLVRWQGICISVEAGIMTSFLT